MPDTLHINSRANYQLLHSRPQQEGRIDLES